MVDADDEYASECISSGSTDDEGCMSILISKHLVVKLTERKKDVSEARWMTEGSFVGMAEVTKVKGKLLQTTGIVREGRIFLHIEEIGLKESPKVVYIRWQRSFGMRVMTTILRPILEETKVKMRNDNRKEIRYLMQREALNLYHQGFGMTIMTLYSYMMKNECGCTWDAFKVYQELKTLGYIVSRHKIPWSISGKASVSNTNMLGCSSGELSSCFELVSLGGSVRSPNRREDLNLVFDIFIPNSKFKKSDPGKPDFSLLISSDRPPGLVEIEALRAQNGDVPVMIATVDIGRE